MIFNIFLIISFFILIVGSFYLLNKFKKIEENSNEPSDGYLKARKIFVRDPEAFRDKDHDGIDDIIDKDIK
ncbi:MAG: hypothetical protein EBX41_09000 [Chitinophagia bacterium]|nr:hypothetical protein [Chitinophagia bacterium]